MRTKPQPPAPRWVVVCEDATVGPFRTEEAAAARLEAIARIGGCRHDHVVREATVEDLEVAY